MWLPEYTASDNRSGRNGGYQGTGGPGNILAKSIEMLHPEWGQCSLQKKGEEKMMEERGGGDIPPGFYLFLLLRNNMQQFYDQTAKSDVILTMTMTIMCVFI